MNRIDTARSSEAEPTPEGVAAYLRSHPEFFDAHPDVRPRESAPSGTVSLVDRRLKDLRDRHADLETRHLEMLELARENESLLKRFHDLAKSLISGPDYPETLAIADGHLCGQFDATAVAFLMFTDPVPVPAGVRCRFISKDEGEPESFQSFIRGGKASCGRLPPDQLRYLFGDDYMAVRSVALIPLGTSAQWGIMAIGSGDKHRYHEDMGTVFLDQLGGLIAARLARSCKG
ncbi:MAG: DUF484 family protein [Gammaproteobacteria bacterium]